MLKLISWIKHWVAYRHAAGRLIVACSWCRTVAKSDGFMVNQRTGLAVLPPGWDRVEGTPLCPLCVSLYCTDRPVAL
ncbi:hypothetical protein [Streptomyces swartbergensis]|uniref:hypothetical protein n=1 Tax=Streptomyces swartbergensis TaxID=487165 RepID=UPI0011800D0F|nr:hypothetical protein [Streptomyces swartbergensis]